LKPGHIEDFYRTLYKEGLAANSVIHYHNNIRKSLQALFKKQIIPNNPADLIDNRPERTVFEASYYNEDEFNEYLKIVRDTKMEIPVILGGVYGFRRSEAIGLKHSAIDYKEKRITVQHTVTVANISGKLEIVREDGVKTKTSRRSMRLLPVLEDAIERSKTRQAHFQKKLGKLYSTKDRDYLCLNEYGHLLTPGHVTRKHKEILDYHGLRHIRYHDLRHSSATILLSKGIPLNQIQRWLGHSDIGTTMRYAHLQVDKAIDDMAEVMESLIVYDDNEKSRSLS
jgi:integrase